MILYEDIKPIECVLLYPICIFSHRMCAFKHWYKIIFMLFNTQKLLKNLFQKT